MRSVEALKRLLLGVLLAAVAGAPAQARPDPRAAQVDLFLRGQMRAMHIPGMQAAVVSRGRIVLLRAYGTASLELGVPVTNRTLFAINSVTKAFTGVAAMQLVAAGRLDLSAPVSTYLDDLPESWRGVTIRQLLSHMSGLPDIMRAPTVETDEQAAWTWVRNQPVRFAAGQRFDYCQTNYTLIQQVINRLTGRAWDAPPALAQIQAAGLARILYGDSTELVPGKAPTYRYLPPASGPQAATGQYSVAVERFLPFRRASSGLNANAEDLARWIVALQAGRLLPAAAREMMWARVPFNDGTLGQWGLGWQVLERGNGRAVGMTGGGRAAFFIYPEQDVAVVLLTNLAGAFPEDMIDRIAALYAPGLRLSGVPALRIALEQNGYAHAAEAAAAVARRDPALRWNERELNDWGYRLLSSGRPREGLEVLKLVAGLFPRSGNAEDSLAEAYAVNGDRIQAIAHYRRALELDPADDNGRRRLERLGAAGNP
jgi:CubicO group peptidase (beta-lactamase class C family)